MKELSEDDLTEFSRKVEELVSANLGGDETSKPGFVLLVCAFPYIGTHVVSNLEFPLMMNLMAESYNKVMDNHAENN